MAAPAHYLAESAERNAKEYADKLFSALTKRIEALEATLTAAPASAEPVALDAFKAIEAESNQLRELCTKHRNEAEKLREALSDLMTWFPDNYSPAEWRLKAGEHGADDAIEAARAALGITIDT